MTKQSLSDILEEYYMKRYAEFIDIKPEATSLATSAIKKLFLEWVGENLSLVNPPHGNIEWLKGYNQRGEEIRRKIK